LFFAVTSAPGTTPPVESVTVPEIVDVELPCATAGDGLSAATIVTRSSAIVTLSIRAIMNPSSANQ
jgi:hypothetical protein